MTKLVKVLLFQSFMKQLLFLLLFTISYYCANSSEIDSVNPDDSLEIMKWTKEDFIKELGFNDTANALINLFFAKNRNGKYQTIFGGVFLIGGVAAIATPFERANDAKSFLEFVRPVSEPGAIIIGSIFTTSGIIKLQKYTFRKLFLFLTNYKNGIALPEKYKRKLKEKYFPRRFTITPRF